MSSTETLYSARFELPELFELGRNQVIMCRVYRSGALVAPTEAGSTVTIYNASNTAVVSAAAVTVSGSVARYTALAAALGTTPGEGWQVEWSLVMPDGVTHVFRTDAALVRRRLYPVITEADLYRRVSGLDGSQAAAITSQTAWADKIDEAWVTIQQMLIRAGNRPNLVTSPSSFREAHLELTLALIFEDFASRLNEAYGSRATAHRENFRRAWSELRFLYDADDSGQADSASSRKAAPRSVWLCGRGR